MSSPLSPDASPLCLLFGRNLSTDVKSGLADDEAAALPHPLIRLLSADRFCGKWRGVSSFPMGCGGWL